MKTAWLLTLIIFSQSLVAQENVNIVTIIDDLTVRWDQTAINMKTYQGIHNFCGKDGDRDKTVELLDQIHHWDTTLYFIVQNKYADTNDKEAEATLRDIETLETDYTTRSFRRFIHQECNTYNDIEKNLGREKGAEYKEEVKVLEKELKKYVVEITKQIDLIDEHVHHLHLGED